MRVRVAVTLSVLVCAAVLRPQAFDARLPIVQVEAQPLAAQAARIADALAYVGSPLPPADRDALRAAAATANASAAIQAILDPLLPARDPHQPGEPREGRAGAGPRRADRARLAHLPGQGPQRGRRHGAAPRVEPQRAAGVLARTARLQHGSAAGADHLGGRCRRPLARPGAVRQAAAGRRASPAWRSSTASSSSTAATPASARRRWPSTSGRARRTSASATTSPILFTVAAVGRRDASRPRRARRADRSPRS